MPGPNRAAQPSRVVGWRRDRSARVTSRSAPFWKRLESVCAEVHRSCGDRESQRRLELLRTRLRTAHRGVREAAIAELEVASLLVRTGGRVSWLPESRARTADLECHVENERFYIEVTAMIGAFRHTHGIPAHRALFLHDPEGPVTGSDVLIHRILARIAQKSRQLSDYVAPVVLAVSVPPQPDGQGAPRPVMLEVDLRRLAGAITSMLLPIAHLSCAILSLWDVVPLPASSAVRLANVGLVERNPHQVEYPQVRLLVNNPKARAPLTRRQEATIRRIL